MKDQLTFDQLFQTVVEHVRSFLFQIARDVRLAGVFLPQGVNGRCDIIRDLFAGDDRIVDDGEDAIRQFRPQRQAGTKDHQPDRNETTEFHQIFSHTNNGNRGSSTASFAVQGPS